MKLLKTILTAFLLLQAAVSFGQTKEETISWLKANANTLLINTYTVGPYQFSNSVYMIDNENITLCRKEVRSTEWNYTEYYNLPFKSILYQDVNTIHKATYTSDGKPTDVYYFIIKLEPKSGAYKYSDKNIQKEIIDDDYVTFYFMKDSEQDIKRILKAIMHLAKLSGAKENKQTF